MSGAALEHREGGRSRRAGRIDERHLAQLGAAIAGIGEALPRRRAAAAGVGEPGGAEVRVLPVRAAVAREAQLRVDGERSEAERLPCVVDEVHELLLLAADPGIDGLQVAVGRDGAAGATGRRRRGGCGRRRRGRPDRRRRGRWGGWRRRWRWWARGWW